MKLVLFPLKTALAMKNVLCVEVIQALFCDAIRDV